MLHPIDSREGEAPAEPGLCERLRLGGSLALPVTLHAFWRSRRPLLSARTIPSLRAS